jgi:aminomethyltransferase
MQGYDVDVQNVSDQSAQLALQGPKAEEILQKLVDIQLKEEIKFFYFKPNVMIDGIKAMVSRTGYTGEDGFEIYIKANNAATIWGKLLEAGKAEGLMPVGLGARDTLRFEAALPLYGHELTKDISPIEAGLEKFVKLDKNEFIGKVALINQKDVGVSRKLVGFEMVDRGIARSNYEIQVQGNNIGFVTSGSFSPTLNKNIGLALVEVDYSKEDIEIDIVIRNKLVRAKIIKTPFNTKKYKK